MKKKREGGRGWERDLIKIKREERQGQNSREGERGYTEKGG